MAENQTAPKTIIEDAAARADAAKASFPVAYNATDNTPSGLTGAKLLEGIASGAVRFKKGSSIPVIAPDGTPGTVPDETIQTAVAKGFRLDDPNNMVARQVTKENPTWSRVGAALHAGSEAFLGLPEKVADSVLPGSPSSDHPVVTAIQTQAAIQNPATSAISRGIAEAVPMVTGLGEAGGLAKGAEALVLGEKAVAKAVVPKAIEAGAKQLEKAGMHALADEAAATAGPTLARQVAGSAAKYATEGTLVSTPEAAHHLFEGDPEKAAESLLWGAGVGALLGGAGKVARIGTGKIAPYAERYATTLAEGIAADPEGAIAKVAEKAATSGLRGAAAAIGHAIPGGGGLLGYVASKEAAAGAGKLVGDAARTWAEGDGRVAAQWLKELAQAPLERGLGKGLFDQGLSVVAQNVSRVPAVIAGMASDEGTKVMQEREAKRFTAEETAQISAAAIRLASSPQAMIDATSKLAQPLDHSVSSANASLQLQNKMINAVQFIADNAPKPPRAPAPFERSQWQPDPMQLASQARRLEVVHDPFIVLKKMADGTLTQEHVDTLNALYPKIAEDIRKGIVSTAAMASAPKLTVDQRNKLSMLMGAPLDPLFSPSQTRSLQAGFASAPPAGPPPSKGQKRGPGRPPKLSYDRLPSYGTDIQNVQFTGTRRGR